MCRKILRILLFLNAIIFPFLIPLVYFFLLIETYSYIGFLRKFFGVDSRFFLVLGVFSGIGVILGRVICRLAKNRPLRLIDLVFNLNFVLNPVIIFFYFILVMLEAKYYPNYVFSRYHLQPDNFFNLVIFVFFLSFLGIIYKGLKSDRSLINFTSSIKRIFYFLEEILTQELRKKSGRFLILKVIFLLSSSFFVLGYFLTNLVDTFSLAIKNNLFIATHLNNSYDDKMKYVWGFYYDFMKFVDNYSREGAVIVLPPNKYPWLSEGNPNLTRYFLYPKYVLNGEDENLPEKDFDYVVIAKGSWDREGKSQGWPRFFIEAKRVFFYDGAERGVKVVEGNFYPELMYLYGSWGLIEVKKH